MSSMLVPLERPSAVLVMISSKSASFCNRSHARLVDSSKYRAFWRQYPNMMPSYGGLLEPRGLKLSLLQILYAGCLDVYLLWFRCSSLVKCVSQFKIEEKFTINPYFGNSRLFKVIDVGKLVTPKACQHVMISSKYVSVGNRSYAKRVSSGKITICSGSPLFGTFVRWESPNLAPPNLLARNERVCAVMRWKPGVSISPELGLVPGCDRQTDRPKDGRTDRITTAIVRA